MFSTSPLPVRPVYKNLNAENEDQDETLYDEDGNIFSVNITGKFESSES